MEVLPKQKVGNHFACPVRIIPVSRTEWSLEIEDDEGFKELLEKLEVAWQGAKKCEGSLRVDVRHT